MQEGQLSQCSGIDRKQLLEQIYMFCPFGKEALLKVIKITSLIKYFE